MAKADSILSTKPAFESALAARLASRFPAYFYDHNIGRRFASDITVRTYHGSVSKELTSDLQTHYHPKESLRRFERPVLIIQGHQDPMPEGVAYEIHSTFTNSDLVFLNRCGHFPWLECPAQLYEVLREFLKAIPDNTAEND
jgi:proline iminopeptidase